MFRGFVALMSVSLGVTAFAADVRPIYDRIAELQSVVGRNDDRLSDADVQAIVSQLNQAISRASTPSEGGSDVIRACTDVFGNGSRGSECARNARDGAVVRACGQRFGNGSAGYDCAVTAHSADVVNSCSDVFGNGSAGRECVAKGIDGPTIRACGQYFGNGSSGRQCAEQALSAERVKACVESFGNGSRGLECAIGQN